MQFFIEPGINIGFMTIRYYGLVYALGIILIYYILKKHKDKLQLGVKQIDSLIVYVGFGMIIGGRIVHYLFFDPSLFWTKPWELLFIWNGGMAFFGGFLGAFVGGYFFCKKYKKDLIAILDITVVPGAFILIFGRLANFINQELVGTIANPQVISWCFEFWTHSPLGEPIFDAVCRHPYPLYASFSHLILFSIVYFTTKNIKGLRTWVFLGGYGLLRFLTDFFREESVRYFGLSSWQIISFLLFCASMFMIYTTLKNHNKNHIHDEKHSKRKSHR